MAPPTEPATRASRALLIWAVSATLAAIVLGNLALVFWMRLREASGTTNRAGGIERRASRPNPSNPPLQERGANSFAALQESNVMGRYRFFESGSEAGT